MAKSKVTKTAHKPTPMPSLFGESALDSVTKSVHRVEAVNPQKERDKAALGYRLSGLGINSDYEKYGRIINLGVSKTAADLKLIEQYEQRND